LNDLDCLKRKQTLLRAQALVETGLKEIENKNSTGKGT
jgi:hypothetical protein